MKVEYGKAVDSRPLLGDDDPTPDWLLVSLLKDVAREKPRYDMLRRYSEGDPPKPETPDSVNDQWVEFERFRCMARSNFAALVTGACLDKSGLQGFRTAAQGDEDGDKRADELWEANDMSVKADKAMKDFYDFGKGFLANNPLTKRASVFRPWQAGAIHDVAGNVAVAVTVQHQPLERRDYAHLWMRDTDENGLVTGDITLHIAVRDRENRMAQKQALFDGEVPVSTYLSRGWHWWKTITFDGTGEHQKLQHFPVTVLENRDGVGEFEQHLDILDRINHMLLQRVVVATMQAFRQRAIQGDLPKVDEQGNKVDYNEMFPASPGALWVIGKEATMWESQQSDLRGLLDAVKDDVRDLASVTRTPMTYFSPDSANGSAEGASQQREGYTSKMDDRKMRMNGRFRQFMASLFEINGDTERSKVEEIEVLWAPSASESLSERFAAMNVAVAGGMSLKTAMREVLKWNPKQMRAAEIERIAGILTAAAAEPIGAGQRQTPMQRRAEQRATQQQQKSDQAKTQKVSSGNS